MRTGEEYAGQEGYPCDPWQGHIPGAVHVPLDELLSARREGDEAVRSLLASRGVPAGGRRIVAYCHSGQRSGIAVAALRASGLEAENYEGSWHEWSRRRRPASGAP
ncbi:MAG: hypothetical protein ICV74_03090 [Thermoleophilia bacterium]|nr:hypothetical protein [Thermoleophilia bacterium]